MTTIPGIARQIARAYFGAACFFFLLGAAPLAAGWSDDPECQFGEGEAIPTEKFVECYEVDYFTVRCFQGGRKIFEQGGLWKDKGVFRTKEGKEVTISKSSDTTCITTEED